VSLVVVVMMWIASSSVVSAQSASTPSAESTDDRDSDPATDEAPAEPASLTPEQEGTGLKWLAGEFAILDPDAAFGEYAYAGGFSLHAMGGRHTWPFMIGLGGGILIFDASSARGPSIGYTCQDNGFVCCRTTIDRSVEIRHAEFLLRVQPFWGVVRPFVEVALGFAALWHFNSLNDQYGGTIASRDEQLSVSFLYGGTLGIDWRLHSSGPGPSWTADIVLTTGVTRYYTGAMERPRYLADIDQQPTVTKLDAPLSLWMPFVAIAISLDSRPGSHTLPTRAE
jgi:hypothetical protein